MQQRGKDKTLCVAVTFVCQGKDVVVWMHNAVTWVACDVLSSGA